MIPLFVPRESVASNLQKPAALSASSFYEMYNCTKLHTVSAVARVTKDRAARPHLPSTVENQLGRRRQLLTVVGYFNARIGKDNDKWPLVMGKHGIGKCNSNGELLLALCSEFELIVTNTMFKQKDERKTTWMHPRSKHWHMIDFIITRCRDKMDIHSTRVMRGANCWTDHQMLRSKVAFRIRQKRNRQGTSKPTKLNIAILSTTSHREFWSGDGQCSRQMGGEGTLNTR